MEKLLKDPDYGELAEMLDDLELEAVWRVDDAAPLTRERLRDALQEKGYRVYDRYGNDFLVFQKGKEVYFLLVDSLPVINLHRAFDVGVKSVHADAVRLATLEINEVLTPVKMIYDEESKMMGINIVARHEDVRSFIDNLDYYLDEIQHAANAWEYRVWEQIEPLYLCPSPARNRLNN